MTVKSRRLCLACDGGNKECIYNFGSESPLKTYNWRTMKDVWESDMAENGSSLDQWRALVLIELSLGSTKQCYSVITLTACPGTFT
jgi:hypothetical protein